MDAARAAGRVRDGADAEGVRAGGGRPARGPPLGDDALPAPAGGRAGDRPHDQVERAGRTLTTVSGRLEQDGKLMGIALGAYSTPWESPLLEDAPIPEVDPPRTAARRHGAAYRSVKPPPFVEPNGLPAALRRGAVQPRRARARSAAGWACRRSAHWTRRGRGAGGRVVPRAVAAAAGARAGARRSSSRSTSARRCRSRTRSCWAASAHGLVRDGFFEEDGELWSPDGTLVAQSRQLGLLIGAEAWASASYE